MKDGFADRDDHFPLLRTNVFKGASILAKNQGDFVVSMKLLEEALALDRTSGDPATESKTLNHMGIVAFEWSDYPWARSCYEDALEIVRELGHSAGPLFFCQMDKIQLRPPLCLE